MIYCRLHTQESLQDEEGDGCPLCNCMNEKADKIDLIKRISTQLSQAQARIGELEALVNEMMNFDEFAILRVRKTAMPPGASLVVCYEVGGVPRIDDDRYPEFVVVRREDLEGFLDGALEETS